jgi:hypothetical protein
MLPLQPGLAISPDETARLRAWHNSLPLTMTRADLALCARYFDLLDALAARADSDPAEIARIRTEPPIRILRFLSARASAARFWACGLLPAWACYRFCRSLCSTAAGAGRGLGNFSKADRPDGTQYDDLFPLPPPARRGPPISVVISPSIAPPCSRTAIVSLYEQRAIRRSLRCWWWTTTPPTTRPNGVND